MNASYQATHTKLNGAVGGEWPELGCLPPTPPQSRTPPVNLLKKGEDVCLSDALIVFHLDAPADEAHSGQLKGYTQGKRRRFEVPANARVHIRWR